MPEPAKHDVALGEELHEAIERDPERHGAVTLDEPLADRGRPAARPLRRLVRAVPALLGRPAGRRRPSCPRLAELGFDVVYLPPIHPIGLTNRKGRDNALTAGPGDPGSPWAIGDASGGHDAVHAELGTIDDLRSADRGRRARTASTSRWTSRSSARPTTRG